MKSKRRAITCLAAILLLSLLVGCRDQSTAGTPSPTESTATIESLEPSESAEIPAYTESPEPTDTPEPGTSPEINKTHNPNLDWEVISFPDLDGFEKVVVEEEAVVVYNNGMVSLVMQYLEATEEQLNELSQGGGPAIEEVFNQLVSAGAATAGELIDLPGLNREGLELEVNVEDDNEYIGLLVPSNGQMLALFGMAASTDKQVLLDGYDQLVEKLTA